MEGDEHTDKDNNFGDNFYKTTVLIKFKQEIVLNELTFLLHYLVLKSKSHRLIILKSGSQRNIPSFELRNYFYRRY